MSVDDSKFQDTIVISHWKIITGLDFCERFLLRDPTQPKIVNPDYDDTQPITPINSPEIFPPLDLNNYTVKMDIRTGDTRDSALIHTIETGGGGASVNDPDVGFVTMFIDGSLTGAEDTGIADFAGRCTFFDLILMPNQPGKKDIRLFKGELPIIEATTNV